MPKIPFLVVLVLASTWARSVPDVSHPTSTESLVISPVSNDGAASSSTESNSDKGNNIRMPKISEMSIDTNVTNRFATTLITSKVKNAEPKAQEAVFSVVLPESAYISEFVMEIGDKSYKAYIKEKEEAKKIYDQAVQSGTAAAHVAVSARDSNRFTVAVNLEPESKAVFKLTYEELLQRKNSQYEVVLTIQPGQLVKKLKAQVNINETRPLRFVKAAPLRSGNEIGKDKNLDPLADVEIFNATSAVVRFSPDLESQKQFAQGLGTAEDGGLAGQFVVQYDVERDSSGGEILVKDGYFVHFFAPTNMSVLPKHVVFVLDTSGSMYGTRITQLKEAMNNILDELNTEDVFSIVRFGDTADAWNLKLGNRKDDRFEYYTSLERKADIPDILPESVSATESNIKKAKEYIQQLTPFGSTNIEAGLRLGLNIVRNTKNENKTANHQPLIIFLTDGGVNTGHLDVEPRIRSQNTGLNCPIFALSFGDSADRDFLQRISLQNNGFARHIYEAADASLQIQDFYKQISSPLLRNVTFKYVSKVSNLTRNFFPVYYDRSEEVLTGCIDTRNWGKTGHVEGESEGGIDEVVDIEYGVDIRALDRFGPVVLRPKVEEAVGSLERLWAYLTVRQILEARNAADNDKELYTQKALNIALKYSFVTPVSSLVVVKPNDTKDDVGTVDASKTNFYDVNYGFNIPPALYPIPGTFNDPDGSLPSYTSYAGTPIRPITTSKDHVPLPSLLPLPIIPTENSQKLLEKLKKQLPWLDSVLGVDETLKLSKGDYSLGLNETVLMIPKCNKNPVNGSTGICVLLHKCPVVYPKLTNLTVYEEYFCPLDKFAGVCCPN